MSSDNLNANRFIESEFPHMEHLNYLEFNSFISNHSDTAIIHQQLENLFQKNPQIQSVFCSSYLSDFIQIINKNLPNLEYFAIWHLDWNIQPARLDHVKHFSVQSYDNGPIDRLSFPRLVNEYVLCRNSYS